MKVSILTIGDEILNGSTMDTNVVFIAKSLTKLGVEIVNMQSVPDQSEEIKAALDFLNLRSDLILITGGLGPTKDDITIRTLANYFGQKLVFNQSNYLHVKQIFSKRGKENLEIDKERCMFPENTIFLPNKKGTAPGMCFEKNKVSYISLPGVPLEMQQIFVNEVLPKIKTEFKIEPIMNKYILTAGIWESLLAKKIEDIENQLPENIKIAYLPKLGEVKLRITGKACSEKTVQKVQDKLLQRLGHYAYSTEETASLQQIVGNKLDQLKKTLTIAESCTGGKLAHKITSIAGSSSYFKASLICYSNEEKMNKLGITKSILQEFGAVSKQTVEAMANAVLNYVPSHFSIAISGIAGPTGGTQNKPVGTVWIAVADDKRLISEKFQFGQQRNENIELACNTALNMLRKFIENKA